MELQTGEILNELKDYNPKLFEKILAERKEKLLERNTDDIVMPWALFRASDLLTKVN